MYKIICVIFLVTLCAFSVYESQAKLNVQYEDFILQYLDKEYLDPDFFEVAVNYKQGSRNTLKMKLKLVKDLPQDLLARFSVWTGALGQYKIPIISQNDLIVCDSKNYDLYFDAIFAPTGIKKEECPAKKGEYVNEDYYPEITAIQIPDIPKNFLRSQIRFDIGLYTVRGDIVKLQIFLKV